MSVAINVYTYYGVKIPYDSAFSDTYDKVYEICDVDVILDGMCGEYIVLGHRLYNSGDICDAFEDGDNWKEIDIEQLPKYEIEYKEAFKKWFPEFFHLIDKPFKLMTFTHWS